MQESASLYDEVEFDNVPQDSILLSAVMPRLKLSGFHPSISHADICPFLTVPSSTNEYLQALNPAVRHRLKRAQRTFADKGVYSIKTIHSSTEMQSALQDLIRLHQLRWNRAGYLGLFAEARFVKFQEEIASTFLNRGILWLKTVQMNGNCIAVRLGFRFKDCLYDYIAGFDDHLPSANRRPGLALLLSMIQDAVNSGIRRVDFLRGNEKYKRELTSEAVFNWNIHISSPDVRHKVRVLTYKVTKFLGFGVRKISSEWGLLEVHYRTHGLWSFLFQYAAFRSRRCYEEILGDTHGLSRLLKLMRIDKGLRQWLSKVIKGNKIPVVQKISQSLRRDRELPASRKIYKAFIFGRSMLLGRLYLWKCDKVGRRVRTRGRPYIDNAGSIVIGDDFNLNSRIIRSELATGYKGVIEIGNEVGINYGASISAQVLVKVGNRVRIGPLAMIIDSDFHNPLERYSAPEGKPIIIEDDVWLGARVTVLKGTTIGRGSTITAGSVVSGIIPPFVIAGGVPGRVIRRLRSRSTPPPRLSYESQEESATGTVLKRVTDVFSKTFSLDGSINLSWGPKDIGRWDSLGHLSLILGLEKEFGITFTEDDMLSMDTVGKVHALVKRHVVSRSHEKPSENLT